MLFPGIYVFLLRYSAMTASSRAAIAVSAALQSLSGGGGNLIDHIPHGTVVVLMALMDEIAFQHSQTEQIGMDGAAGVIHQGQVIHQMKILQDRLFS